MTFQQICRTYQQNIQSTHTQTDATAELSLHPHLKTFLEKTAELLEYPIIIMSGAAQTGDWEAGFCCEKRLTAGRLY